MLEDLIGAVTVRAYFVIVAVALVRGLHIVIVAVALVRGLHIFSAAVASLARSYRGVKHSVKATSIDFATTTTCRSQPPKRDNDATIYNLHSHASPQQWATLRRKAMCGHHWRRYNRRLSPSRPPFHFAAANHLRLGIVEHYHYNSTNTCKLRRKYNFHFTNRAPQQRLQLMGQWHYQLMEQKRQQLLWVQVVGDPVGREAPAS
jgi:hypothetical protein